MPRFTDAFLESLAADGRDRLIFDDRQPGFGVRITPTGTKIFVAQARVAGRKRRVTVGFHPEQTLAKARDEALQMLADMRRGCDPVVERKARIKAAQAGEMTISELGDKWLREHVFKLRPRTVGNYKRLLTQFIKPVLGHLTVAHIEHDDVNKFHVAMRRTPRQANHAVATLRTLLNFAGRLGLRPPASNPARGVKMYRERVIERFLSDTEIGKAADGIDQAEQDGTITPHGAAGLRLALLTGARSGEVTAIEWTHVHPDLRLIRIPDSIDEPGRKTGARTIHLSDAALEVLASIPRVGKFVIAGDKEDEPYKNLTRAWTKARAYAGLDDVRLHDLRHSFGSLAARKNVSLLVIGKLLGHKVPATTKRYAHLCQDVAASINDDLGAAMTAAIEKGRAKKAANVVVKFKR
jgi:integrase